MCAGADREINYINLRKFQTRSRVRSPDISHATGIGILSISLAA